MSNEMCDAVLDALAAGAPVDAYGEHVTSCAQCQGAIEMTQAIRKETEAVPAMPGQLPQWIVQLHARGLRRRRHLRWAASGFAAVAAVLAVVFTFDVTRATKPKPDVQPTGTLAPNQIGKVAPPVATTNPTPTVQFQRPDWVMSDVPFTGYCKESSGKLQCVGVSAYRPNKEDARRGAIEVAYDALASEVAARIHTHAFDRYERVKFAPARDGMLADYAAVAAESHSVAPNHPAYVALAEARHRAAEALRTGAAGVIPTIPSDWYWEEYQAEPGDGTEFLVFVRFDLDTAQLDRLVEIYGTGRMTAPHERTLPKFPSLAFSSKDFTGGEFTAFEP